MASYDAVGMIYLALAVGDAFAQSGFGQGLTLVPPFSPYNLSNNLKILLEAKREWLLSYRCTVQRNLS